MKVLLFRGLLLCFVLTHKPLKPVFIFCYYYTVVDTGARKCNTNGVIPGHVSDISVDLVCQLQLLLNVCIVCHQCV